MKKLLTVCLILALFLPAASLADEQDVIGCWSSYETLNTGAPYITSVFLSEDHTCYFVSQFFKPDEAGVGRAYVGTWEYNNDGTVYVKTGNNTYITLTFSDSYVGAFDTRNGSFYVNVSKFLE